MLWKLTPTPPPTDRPDSTAHGRFILHRHADAHGPHLDLRLEAGPCLLGWRIDGPDLRHERYATEKPPHPLHWLDRDGDALREDAGAYAWLDQSEDGGTLELRGETATQWIRVEHQPTPSPTTLAAIVRAIDEHNINPEYIPVLIHDGRLARHRAILRLCALGRELDAAAFDETRWKTLLAYASLDEIHHHLRAYEIRFDKKYPPQPTSQPEPLEEDQPQSRNTTAWTILQTA